MARQALSRGGDRLALYRAVRPHLPEEARAYWDGEGDRIEIRDDGLVYVNGAPLDEASYTFQNPDGENAPTKPLNGTSSWLLGPHQLFVMGDHREASTDSRVFGPIDATTVVGRAFLRYWPATTFGILAAPSYP